MTISDGNIALQSLVRAKLHAPRIALDIVLRERLLDQLPLVSDRQFTLVSAPAGYGKSTLVAHWLITTDVSSTWFSIEESDNDVRQFLTYLVAAIRTHSENACAATLEALSGQELPPAGITSSSLTSFSRLHLTALQALGVPANRFAETNCPLSGN